MDQLSKENTASNPASTATPVRPEIETPRDRLLSATLLLIGFTALTGFLVVYARQQPPNSETGAVFAASIAIMMLAVGILIQAFSWIEVYNRYGISKNMNQAALTDSDAEAVIRFIRHAQLERLWIAYTEEYGPITYENIRAALSSVVNQAVRKQQIEAGAQVQTERAKFNL